MTLFSITDFILAICSYWAFFFPVNIYKTQACWTWTLVAQAVKNLPAVQEAPDWFLGQEDPLEEAMQPLQYSCLENSMDRGAWWATVHEVTKSWTWLKDLAQHCTHLYNMEFNLGAR